MMTGCYSSITDDDDLDVVVDHMCVVASLMFEKSSLFSHFIINIW